MPRLIRDAAPVRRSGKDMAELIRVVLEDCYAEGTPQSVWGSVCCAIVGFRIHETRGQQSLDGLMPAATKYNKDFLMGIGDPAVAARFHGLRSRRDMYLEILRSPIKSRPLEYR